MSEPTIIARIAITSDEWRDLRIAAVEKDKRPSELLADLVRKHLAKRAT